MQIENLRYIVFVIDSKYKSHDGKIFSSVEEAREFVVDTMDYDYGDKAVIGCFHLDKDHKEMLITHIDSVGFKGDKKNINQTQLF